MTEETLGIAEGAAGRGMPESSQQNLREWGAETESRILHLCIELCRRMYVMRL